MIRLTRLIAGAAGLLVACGLLAAGTGAAAPLAVKSSVDRGRADRGVAYLAITRSRSTALEYAAGENKDRVLGAGASTYVIRAVFSPSGIHLTVKPVVFYSAAGSLTGTATGTATVAAGGETIAGRLALTHGAGDQKGHSLIGTFIAKSDSTFKFLTLTYKGTYR